MLIIIILSDFSESLFTPPIIGKAAGKHCQSFQVNYDIFLLKQLVSNANRAR